MRYKLPPITPLARALRESAKMVPPGVYAVLYVRSWLDGGWRVTFQNLEHHEEPADYLACVQIWQDLTRSRDLARDIRDHLKAAHKAAMFRRKKRKEEERHAKMHKM